MTAEQENILYTTIVDGFSIYESLNTVEEFPDYFEETLNIWAQYLYTVLGQGSDYNSEKFIESKKAAVDIICLLLGRFSEFMKDYRQGFFDKIWGMLNALPQSKIFNEFVSSLTDFISISLRDSSCFNQIKEKLEDLFSNFLVFHMAFNAEDLEEFEGDEEAFIKMDLEEHDKETRRRSCFDLVKVQCDI